MKREPWVIEMVISLGKNWERVKETKPSMQTGSTGVASRLRAAWSAAAWRESRSRRLPIVPQDRPKLRLKALPL